MYERVPSATPGTLNQSPESSRLTDVVEGGQPLGAQSRAGQGGKTIWRSKDIWKEPLFLPPTIHSCHSSGSKVQKFMYSVQETTKVQLPYIIAGWCQFIQTLYWNLKFSCKWGSTRERRKVCVGGINIKFSCYYPSFHRWRPKFSNLSGPLPQLIHVPLASKSTLVAVYCPVGLPDPHSF